MSILNLLSWFKQINFYFFFFLLFNCTFYFKRTSKLAHLWCLNLPDHMFFLQEYQSIWQESSKPSLTWESERLYAMAFWNTLEHNPSCWHSPRTLHTNAGTAFWHHQSSPDTESREKQKNQEKLGSSVEVLRNDLNYLRKKLKDFEEKRQRIKS